MCILQDGLNFLISDWFVATSQHRLVQIDVEWSFFDDAAEYFPKMLEMMTAVELVVWQEGFCVWMSGDIIQINFEWISCKKGLEDYFGSVSVIYNIFVWYHCDIFIINITLSPFLKERRLNYLIIMIEMSFYAVMSTSINCTKVFKFY